MVIRLGNPSIPSFRTGSKTGSIRIASPEIGNFENSAEQKPPPFEAATPPKRTPEEQAQRIKTAGAEAEQAEKKAKETTTGKEFGREIIGTFGGRTAGRILTGVSSALLPSKTLPKVFDFVKTYTGGIEAQPQTPAEKFNEFFETAMDLTIVGGPVLKGLGITGKAGAGLIQKSFQQASEKGLVGPYLGFLGKEIGDFVPGAVKKFFQKPVSQLFKTGEKEAVKKEGVTVTKEAIDLTKKGIIKKEAGAVIDEGGPALSTQAKTVIEEVNSLFEKKLAEGLIDEAVEQSDLATKLAHTADNFFDELSDNAKKFITQGVSAGVKEGVKTALPKFAEPNINL